MELNFNKTNQNVYEAIFEATADFNIHLERKSTGIFVIQQSGVADSAFDNAFNLGINAREVIDYDFAALVYPKWIKVVSGSEVVSASVNFNEGGGSGSGSGDNAVYYKFSEPFYLGYDAEMFLKEENVFSGARGYYDKSYGYYYGTASAIKAIVGAKFSSNGYIDAVEFRPIQFLKSWGDMSIITYNDFESLAEAFPDIFGKLGLSRITAEEYWADFNAE